MVREVARPCPVGDGYVFPNRLVGNGQRKTTRSTVQKNVVSPACCFTFESEEWINSQSKLCCPAVRDAIVGGNGIDSHKLDDTERAFGRLECVKACVAPCVALDGSPRL